MDELRHRHTEVCVLQVYGATPKTQGETRSYRPHRLHLEPRHHKELVESGEVDDEAKRSTFLGNQENSGEEKRLRDKDLPNLAPREESGNQNPDVGKLRRVATQPTRGIDN